MSLADRYDSFVFDCDGVLWRGTTPIPGSVELLDTLHQRGKRVLFVTNNSSKSRSEYLEKFAKIGVKNVTKHDILSSAYAVPAYLDNLKKSDFDKKTQKVLLLGSSGVAQELDEAGYEYIWVDDIIGSRALTTKELSQLPLDPSVRAVVVGGDWAFTYSKVAVGCRYLRDDPSRLFICTNRDASYPVSEDILLPGTGCFVASVATSVDRQPVNCGKPEAVLMEIAIRRFNLDPERTLMVGDRLDTDIIFGQRGGVSTLLVGTGVTGPKQLQASQVKPRYSLPAACHMLEVSPAKATYAPKSNL